jgi:hypothetical protein
MEPTIGHLSCNEGAPSANRIVALRLRVDWGRARKGATNPRRMNTPWQEQRSLSLIELLLVITSLIIEVIRYSEPDARPYRSQRFVQAGKVSETQGGPFE